MSRHGVSRDPLAAPPVDDADVAAWTAGLGLDGLIDLHVHFLPDRVMAKVWAFFDGAAEHYGIRWPVHYRLPQDDRLAVLRAMDVRVFAPLVYPHKPGMADWLNGWVAEFAAAVPAAVRTATLYPEPGVVAYLERALVGIPFLRAVVRDTPARLLRLPAAGGYHGVVVQPDKGVNGFDSGR